LVEKRIAMQGVQREFVLEPLVTVRNGLPAEGGAGSEWIEKERLRREFDCSAGAVDRIDDARENLSDVVPHREVLGPLVAGCLAPHARMPPILRPHDHGAVVGLLEDALQESRDRGCLRLCAVVVVAGCLIACNGSVSSFRGHSRTHRWRHRVDMFDRHAQIHRGFVALPDAGYSGWNVGLEAFVGVRVGGRPLRRVLGGKNASTVSVG
jgi:hypothetical protein